MAIRLGCVCVAGADGAVRACGRAYARCEERWKVRMGFVELTVVETATSSMRTKRSTN